MNLLENDLPVKVFHHFFLFINKKPVEKVENSVDNLMTSIFGKHPLQTPIFRQCFFVKGFLKKHKKFSRREKALISRAFGIVFFDF